MENKETREEPRSIAPPETVFDRAPQSLTQKVMESSPVHIFTGKVTVPEEGGMNLHFEGMLHPKKGFPFMAAAMANNIVKRQTMLIVGTLVRMDLSIAGLGFIVTPWKWKVRAVQAGLENWCRASDYIIEQFYLKDQFMTPCAKEVGRIARELLLGIGIDERVSAWSAKILAHVVEYDDSYRYRIEDLCSETSAEKMAKDPAGEIARILAISRKREKYGTVSDKFAAFGLPLRFLMIWHPQVKRAFRSAIRPDTFKWVQMDEGDRYQTLLRTDYDFGGRSGDDRFREFSDMHGGKLPRMVQYQPAQRQP